jgi:hypothetical protein
MVSILQVWNRGGLAMGRSGTPVVALGVLLGHVTMAAAQSPEPVPYWQGFYLGIMGTAVADRGSAVGLVVGRGGEVNGAFYFGAEAQLAAGNISGNGPYLWLEADGRLGAQVTETMLLYTSAGLAYDTDMQSIAVTGGAGAEIDLADGFALRAEYVVQHSPAAASTNHGGQAGVVLKFD